MKIFTKLLGIVLIIALVMSMGTMVWADDPAPTTWDNTGSRPASEPAEPTDTTNGDNTAKGTGNFTVEIIKNSTDTAKHTYAAYQLFKGDLYVSMDGTSVKRTLSNIEWGEGIDTTKLATLGTALKAIDGFPQELTFANTAASAAAVAKAIGDLNATHDSDKAQAIAAAFGSVLATATVTGNKDSDEVTGLKAGYYLIKDASNPDGENGAQTRYMLEVVADVTVYEKASVPSVVKKVKETNDSKAASTADPKNPTDWQDAADYDIGDSVPFQITAKTASTAGDYVKYHVTIQDKQSAGLTAPESYKITVLGKEFTLAKNGTAQTEKVGNTNVTVEPVTPDAGQTFAIKVSFVSTTDGAKLGSAVVSQDIVVEYTSELNTSAELGSTGNPNEVYLKYSNNPNSADDNDEGKTPTDKVIVFTYEIKALKVKPTSDAAIDQSAYEALTDAQKADYVKVGDKWQKTEALSGAGFTLFKKDASKTAATQNSFKDATNKGDVVKDGNNYYVAVTNQITGKTTFEFKGTDAGEYKLVETTVPAGYNKCDDIDITVTATYDTDSADPKLKTLTVDPATAGFTVESTTTEATEGTAATTTYNGNITGKVLNQSGAVLPSTGGVGTTIFYVVGSILVVAAGVLLITKKRMGREG